MEKPNHKLPSSNWSFCDEEPEEVKAPASEIKNGMKVRLRPGITDGHLRGANIPPYKWRFLRLGVHEVKVVHICSGYKTASIYSPELGSDTLLPYRWLIPASVAPEYKFKPGDTIKYNRSGGKKRLKKMHNCLEG